MPDINAYRNKFFTIHITTWKVSKNCYLSLRFIFLSICCCRFCFSIWFCSVLFALSSFMCMRMGMQCLRFEFMAFYLFYRSFQKAVNIWNIPIVFGEFFDKLCNKINKCTVQLLVYRLIQLGNRFILKSIDFSFIFFFLF